MESNKEFLKANKKSTETLFIDLAIRLRGKSLKNQIGSLKHVRCQSAEMMIQLSEVRKNWLVFMVLECDSDEIRAGKLHSYLLSLIHRLLEIYSTINGTESLL